jgi:hypothetical protein
VAGVVALGLAFLGEEPIDGGGSDPRPTRPNDSPPPPDSPPDRAGTGTEGGATQPVDTPPDQVDATAPAHPTDTRRPLPRGTENGATGSTGSATALFRCVGQDGEALGGVRIEARRASGAPLTPVISDGGGDAQITGLVAGESIQGVGRHPTSRDAANFGPASVGPSVIVLRFRRSELGDLRGTLRDDAGQPVADAELVLVNPKSPEGQAVLDAMGMGLRADGSFLTRVAVGTYTVSARAPGLSESDRTYVTVGADGAAPNVTIVLNRQGSLAGTVRLPSSLASNPPEVLELVWEVKAGTSANPYTRNGRVPLDSNATEYTLPDCDPGRYRLRLEARLQDGESRIGNWSSVNVLAGQDVRALALTLTEALISVQGTITDDQGTPLAGATVTVGPQRGVTRDDGTYALKGLDLGEAFLEAKLEGHAPGFLPIHYRAQALTVDVVLKRNGGLRGQVTDSNGPAGNTLVLAIQVEDDGVRTHETKTDGQGYYTFQGLSPGTYTLKAGPAADPFSGGGKQVVVQPGILGQVSAIGLE